MSLDLRLTVRSTAMFGTWLFLPTDNLCLDLGDGLVSSLGHKLVAIETVLLSHAHRDHIAGLPMFLNVRCNHEGRVRIIHPAGVPMFDELRAFTMRFERAAGPDRVEWIAARPGEYLPQKKKNLFILPFETNHYRLDDGRVRSLGYHLCLRKKKVKAAYRGLSTADTHALIREKGREEVLEEVEEKYLSYSGDTDVLDPAVYAGTGVLVHEATFMTRADRDDDVGEARWHRHAVLDDVLEMAVAANVGHLALYHVSSRYQQAEVMSAVRAAIRRFRPSFPVSVAPPGRFVPDLLARTVTLDPPREGAREGGRGADRDTAGADAADPDAEDDANGDAGEAAPA